jgi:DNA modification methylase
LVLGNQIYIAKADLTPSLRNRLMRLYTYVGDTILDPFVGSGTTTRAAANIGRAGIGVDISERYLERAAFRCSQIVAEGFF